MSGNQDARPFVDLQKDAEEFRQKFDGDIQKCITFLDAKITALICDPDSLASPSRKSSIQQNALVEFSKAKYDIFISVKTLVNEMEREWIKYISEMKKLFIENVEIFLAGTKLEVKLPTAEFQTSPALGSPLRNKEGKKPKEILDDSLLRNDKEISDDESDSEDKSVKQAQDGPRRQGSGRAILLKDNSTVSGGRVARHARNEVESSDSDASDSESGLNASRYSPRSRGRRSSEGRFNNFSVPKSKSPTVTHKQSDDSDKVPKSKSPAVTYKQSDDSDKGVDSTDVNLNERGRRNESKSANSRVSQAKSSVVAKKNENNEEHDVSSQVSRTTRGRTGKETKSSSSQEQNALSQGSKSRGGRFGKEADSSSSQERDASPQNSKSRGGRSRTDTNSSSSQDSKSRGSRSRKDASSSSSQEHDILPQASKLKRGHSGKDTNSSSSQERDASPQHSALRGSRSRKEAISSQEASQANSTLKSKGRSSSKPTPSKKQARAPAEMTESESEEKIAVKSSTKPSRQGGRTPGKPARSAVQKSSSTTEESESGSSTRQKKTTKLTKSAAQMSTTTEESESESTKQGPRSVTKGKKGRTPAKHRQNNSIDVEPRTTRRGATHETPVAPPSPKKSNIVNYYPEIERSKSPKKVTFTPKLDTSDLDAFTPNLKSKSSIRRKTLLPNLNEIESEDDIIPGTSRGRANKRKTIGGISDFASATPLKRLKVGESRKSVSSNQVDDDADDNLLENDGDYSDWIPLKSIDGKIPTKPGIYEVKVWRAKKPAYIGHCESLRQKLTIHKLRQNSGHKHLDKFIERNMADIQIRYEVMSSNDNAKSEVKNRIKNFVSEYKTTPAYN